MLFLRTLGLRLGMAVLAAASIAAAIYTPNDLPVFLLGIVLAVFFLSILALLLFYDVREWLGYPPAKPTDPDGRPKPVEWLVVVFFNAFCAAIIYVGVRLLPQDSGELLTVGLIIEAVFLFLSAGVVGRWWRHRANRH